MVTIVPHEYAGEKHILLGTRFGASQLKKPRCVFGDTMSDTPERQYVMMSVCNKDETIRCLEPSEDFLESVDRQSVKGELR